MAVVPVCRLARLLVVGLLAAVWPGLSAAQDVTLADRAPRFLVASASPGGAPVEIDAGRHALLRQVVSLDLDRPTVGSLLEEVERQAGLKFYYGEDVLSPDRPVTLRADSITVAAALMGILMDAGVDALLTTGNRVALVKKRPVRLESASGTVSGRVTDAKTGEALVGAEVLLEGTKWRTGTGADGRYRLAEVTAGSYTLAVRRIGYARRTQPVTVVDGEEATVDVALEPVPTRLDEVVTTVTGEQRLRELGHVVGRINADSVVKAAPVSTVSELLNGRVPGLQVFTHSGLVGGQVSLQVRTPNSIILGAEPIVLVDGIRYTSGTTGSGPFSAERTSRLNDLNPNDIASIEVVKGPSAATLYGTDAANGVIVITTKRGQAGPARWNAYARSSISEVPRQHYPESWWGWRTVGGVPSLTSSCSLQNVAQGSCVQDSVTVLPNPLNEPAQTIFGSKPRWEYGANVSGGRQDLRYYFSADFERAIGPIQLPPAVVEQLELQRGASELPEEQREPNAATKMNLRANVTASLGKAAELHLQTGYGHTATRTLTAIVGSGPYGGGARGTPTSPYAPFNDPTDHFSTTSTERVDRFFGSATGQWRPASWLQARGTVGLDLASSDRYSLARVGESSSYANGRAGDDRTRQLAITGDLGLTALARRGRLSFRTAVGAQYARSLANALSSEGRGLPPGGESVGQGATVFASQSYSETVTLGSYLEETVGLNDRLFLTGALRVDGASAFGRDYDAAAYPKASVSWIVSEEPFLPRVPGLDELRVRYAFGASGQQASPTMALPRINVRSMTLDGAATNRIDVTSLGNPNLRPERVREHELGFDASGLAGRLRLGLTWFRRRTTDQILSRSLPPGFGSSWTNLGLTTARGFEAELTARLVETRQVSWQVSVNHSLRRSRVVELGDMAGFFSYRGSTVEGYSLGARFAPPIVSYTDANGDGIIAPAEVQVGTESAYMGESTAPISQTLTTVVGLFQQRLRLSALFERRSGFTQINGLHWMQCGYSRCRGAVDPSAPLGEQAAAARTTVGMPSAAFFEPGDFTRLREVAASLDLPAGLLQAVRLRSATLSVAARNLALWTAFSGPDPESARLNANGYENDAAANIPQGRSWVLRLDLGL